MAISSKRHHSTALQDSPPLACYIARAIKWLIISTITLMNMPQVRAKLLVALQEGYSHLARCVRQTAKADQPCMQVVQVRYHQQSSAWPMTWYVWRPSAMTIGWTLYQRSRWTCQLQHMSRLAAQPLAPYACVTEHAGILQAGC